MSREIIVSEKIYFNDDIRTSEGIGVFNIDGIKHEVTKEIDDEGYELTMEQYELKTNNTRIRVRREEYERFEKCWRNYDMWINSDMYLYNKEFAEILYEKVKRAYEDKKSEQRGNNE